MIGKLLPGWPEETEQPFFRLTASRCFMRRVSQTGLLLLFTIPLLLVGFAARPIRALLFALIDNPPALLAIQLLDGITAAIIGCRRSLKRTQQYSKLWTPQVRRVEYGMESRGSRMPASTR